ncbi:CCHC-type zinc finger nucleic acid binding protein-like [Phymastichus coffea]|uniref:CCHC-type zinc finger nucleic acid binding protein-like n=1 Tax=Phymastichus coffea TaxID=108790 RepID=UPI00273CC04E|nr:CCHC-type zinc finger nucleic acid binding protein-like [Phymastichus coffea]
MPTHQRLRSMLEMQEKKMHKNDQISKQNKCENCDKIGHTTQQCPEVICRKCNNMGHLVKDCKAGEIKKSLYKICAICEEVGHEQDTCDQVKIMFTEFKAKQKFKCQYCEDTGHTAKYCPLLKTQPQQV